MGSPCAVALKVLASFEPIEETICSSMCASMKGILAASIYCFYIISLERTGEFGCRLPLLEVLLSPGTN